MPCYSPPMHTDEFGRFQNGEIPQATFDKLVRMLCEANQIIDNNITTAKIVRNPELAGWWAEHQAFDRKRAKKDKR